MNLSRLASARFSFTRTILFALALLFVSPLAHAGKFYFTLANNPERGGFNSAEFSLSGGGAYTGTVDLGGTLYLNAENLRYLSFDVFSSLESVQQTGFLFAAGAHIFALEAEHKGPPELERAFSYGISAGFDMGYQFPTGIPTVLLWSFDYAPDLLTGGELEELILSSILYEVKFTPIVIGHVSYRYGRGEFSESVPDEISQFENSIGLGIKIRF